MYWLLDSFSFIIITAASNHSLQATFLEERHLVATWSDRGVVGIWDCSKHVLLLDAPSAGGAAGKNLKGHKEAPLFSFSGHQVMMGGVMT